MNRFEPGEYVRLRCGGRTMQVMKDGPSESLARTSSLIACEYRAKNRRVLGFYAAHALISTRCPEEPVAVDENASPSRQTPPD